MDPSDVVRQSVVVAMGSLGSSTQGPDAHPSAAVGRQARPPGPSDLAVSLVEKATEPVNRPPTRSNWP